MTLTADSKKRVVASRRGSAAAKDLTADYADYTDMDRSEFVHGILHEVLWECEASSHRFSINGLLPQKRREDACALQKSRRLRDETTTSENLRRLQKLSSIAVRITRIGGRVSFDQLNNPRLDIAPAYRQSS
jgi:hypothetical protein